MLIKNEINFDGVNGHHNYGTLVMFILCLLSLFGCVLIVIILVKLIITCFFTDKYNHLLCIHSDRKHNKSGANHRRKVSDLSVVSNNSSIDSSNDSKFSNLENIYVEISETAIRTKRQCICPVCDNDHYSTASNNSSSIMDSFSPNLKKGQSKRSSFILRSAQVLSKKLVLKKETKIKTEVNEEIKNNNNDSKNGVIIPIVSKTEKIILKKMDRPIGESKQIANYGDVVLELKQKFSSMTMLNSIV